MALKKMKINLDRVLDKNMQDLVRGIRNHKEEESKYIAECLDEIKQELKSGDLQAKSNAVGKLLYLQMLGYEISWAAFNVIEVMSSVKFTHKRLGYLTASQSFHVDTDVLMLATNMIRKDLCSSQMYDAGVALSGLSCFTSPDLAQDLANDIMSLMMSTRPYLRKKAILLMYKVYLNYPDALRPSFPRLKEKLEDPDPGVQCAAVNVICELARKNPKNYLSLAPTFFKLMTNSSNNWMLIKIIKLFGALTPLEPRLGKKLIEPLTNLIHSTSAMSLLYECINTVIAVLVSISTDLPNHTTSVQLCVQKLRVLIEDSDQNLKYLGLLAFSKILKTHPKSVQAHKDLVLTCLDDRDESIRMRALDLLPGMVSKKNLMEIIKKLMVHMEKAEGTVYRDELMGKIIEICTQNNYQHVMNFEWYVSVLVELTKMKSTNHGKQLGDQMMDVAIRVVAVRKFTIGQMAILLENSHLFAHNSQKDGICEILFAAAWLCGEFAELLTDPMSSLQAMFKPRVTSLPGHIQSVYVQNITKLYSSILVKAEIEGDQEKIREVGQLLLDNLPMFVQSGDLEVQERACSALQLMKYITKLLDKGVNVGEEVAFLFAGDLNPVAPKAQKKVPVPEGLDLDAWINKQPSKASDLSNKKSIFSSKEEAFSGETEKKRQKAKELSADEMRQQRDARLQAQASNPHYLKLGASAPLTGASTSNSDGEEEVLVSKRPKRQRQVGTVLPNICIICGGSDKSKRIGSGTRRRYEELHQTRTHDAGQLIPIAQARGDAMILKHVAGSDAFAREVKYHGSCYKSYIRTPKAGQSKQADTNENRQGLSLFMDHVELRIVTNRGIMRLTELYSIYETIMIDHPNESKLRSDRVKEEMMKKFPSLKFFKSASESLRQSLLVYNETLSATELLATSLLSVQEEASATITTTDSSTETETEYRGIYQNFKTEFFHVCQAIESSIDKQTPRSYDTWPPTLEDFTLESALRYCPAELYNLLACLVTKMQTVVEDPSVRMELPIHTQAKLATICQDIIFLWSNKRILPPKTLALGITLRHLAASKQVNELVHAFGHAASYHTVLRLETALALRQLSLGIPQEFKPEIWTTVVWDNIDFSNETTTGAGTAHYVNGIMTQRSHGDMQQSQNTEPQNIEKSRRTLGNYDKRIVAANKPSKRQGPRQTFSYEPVTLHQLNDTTDFIYICLRHAHHNPSLLPPWTKYNMIINNNLPAARPTLIHYLPLIEASANDHATINTIIARTMDIADELKLKKIVAVFDLAIYAKIQEIRWASEAITDRLIVRLGEFHTIMSYLSILGKRFGSGGLSDIWVEADVVAAGSVKAALLGRQYNRAVRGHKVVYEALSRLQLQDYLTSLPDERQTNFYEITDQLSTCFQELDPDSLQEYNDKLQPFYDEFQRYVTTLASENPTYSYWTSYIRMVELLLILIRSSRLNDWEQHLSCVDCMLPWFFAYDRVNYSRYLPIYLQEMRELDAEENNQLSQSFTVNRAGLPFTGTPMDQTIEQTINKSCKTAGGVSKVTLNPGSFQRWVLSQPAKARISDLCRMMAGMDLGQKDSDGMEFSASSARRHESMVQSVIATVKSMKNPFSGSQALMSISNRVIPSEDVISDITSAYQKGKTQYQAYVRTRLLSKDKQIFETIPMLKDFDHAKKKTTRSQERTNSAVDDRSLYSRLLIASQSRSIDLKQILTYSLTQRPLALATSDGCMRKNVKSTLLHDIEKAASNPILAPVPAEQVCKVAVIVDAMAIVQTLISSLPKTFGDLTDFVLQRLQQLLTSHDATRIDWVCDQYREVTIKGGERDRRQSASGSQRITITDRAQKLPRQWKKYLGNPHNKEELLEFIYTQLLHSTLESDQIIYVTNKNRCSRLATASVASEEIGQLLSGHEEADTRMLFHLKHASQNGFNRVLIVCSDTDVFVTSIGILGAGLIAPDVEVGFVTGRASAGNKRVIDISKIKQALGTDVSYALPFIHALTGCDSTSALHGKGKKKALSLLIDTTFAAEFKECHLYTLPPATALLTKVEEFICQLYGAKSKTCNQARYEIYKSPKKATDAATLPPTSDALYQHTRRALYQSYLWIESTTAQLSIPTPDGHGWRVDDGKLKTVWTEQPTAPAEVLQPKVHMGEEALDIDDIPIETLDLNVDIEMSKGIEGLASADKYYREAMKAEKSKKKSKRKEGKKGKRSKKKRGGDGSEDEVTSPVVQHTVSSVFDMPEGAAAGDSDLDDDGKDDLVKKLDINLDEPLREDERLPVRQHRVEGGYALPDPVNPDEKKKKKKKKEKDSSKKSKSEKKSKTKSLSNELAEAGIIDIVSPPPVAEEPQASASVPDPITNGVDETVKPKKEKSKKKSKSSKHRKDKSLYEVAEGVTTPSKEHTSGTATPTNILDLSSLNLTNYRTLAADENLSLQFEPRVAAQQPNTLVIAVVFHNLTSDKSLKSIDFNVLDSMNAKLSRQSTDEAIKVPFELTPALRNEAQFIFTIKSINMTQKLKGTITYILKDEDGSAQQKLDFRLVVDCRDFLLATPCNSDSFTQLLSDGDLTAKYSKRVSGVEQDFRTLLTKLCFYAHLHIVEQVDNSASLYSRSIQDQHICLLVKYQGDSINIDGKSSDSSFLGNVIDEVAALLTK